MLDNFEARVRVINRYHLALAGAITREDGPHAGGAWLRGVVVCAPLAGRSSAARRNVADACRPFACPAARAQKLLGLQLSLEQLRTSISLLFSRRRGHAKYCIQ